MPCRPYPSGPGHGDTSIIRLAQADTLPHIGLDTTGMAVAIDLGDPKAPAGDVHSRLKEQVAYRLALQAMHVAYAFQEGEDVVNYDHPDLTPDPFPLHFSGPMISSAARTDGQVTLTFEYADGLFLNETAGCEIHRGTGFDGKPIGGECCKAKDTFQLCSGDPGNSTWMRCANATITELGSARPDTVVLTAPAGGAPFTHVKYAYSNYPQCVLYNKYDLPAGPFLQPIEAAGAVAIVSASVPASKQMVAPAMTPPMGLNSWCVATSASMHDPLGHGPHA